MVILIDGCHKPVDTMNLFVYCTFHNAMGIWKTATQRLNKIYSYGIMVHSKICYLLHSLAASLVNPTYYPRPWKWMVRILVSFTEETTFQGLCVFREGIPLFDCTIHSTHSSCKNGWIFKGSCTVWGDPHISTFDSGLFGAEMAPPVSILSSGDYWLVPWWHLYRSLQRKKMMSFVSSGEKGQVCLCFV